MSEENRPKCLGGWQQSARDMNPRREMMQHIVGLLHDEDKDIQPHEWLRKLPAMVQQLEASLYLSAPSFEAYADTSTLKDRLKLLAIEIAKKTSPLDLPANHPLPGDAALSTTNQEDMPEKELRKKQNRLLLLHHTSQCPHAYGKCPHSRDCAEFKDLWRHLSKCTDTSSSCGRPHCVSSRAVLAHYRSCKEPDCRLCGPLRRKILNGE